LTSMNAVAIMLAMTVAMKLSKLCFSLSNGQPLQVSANWVMIYVGTRAPSIPAHRRAASRARKCHKCTVTCAYVSKSSINAFSQKNDEFCQICTKIAVEAK
jgi:hypothetical protein